MPVTGERIHVGRHLLLPANGKRHFSKIVSERQGQECERTAPSVFVPPRLTLICLGWQSPLLHFSPSRGKGFATTCVAEMSPRGHSSCPASEEHLQKGWFGPSVQHRLYLQSLAAMVYSP